MKMTDIYKSVQSSFNSILKEIDSYINLHLFQDSWISQLNCMMQILITFRWM